MGIPLPKRLMEASLRGVRKIAAVSTAAWREHDDRIMAAVVVAIAAVLVLPDLFTGWNYADDGGLAQVAERVLRGEVPHRDFNDPWTGGWSYLQALVFQVCGVRLSLLRVPIVVAWLGGVLIAYHLARRVASCVASAAVALAGALWSLYAYHLPLLSWFYVPCALATCWCLLRFDRSARRVWLMAAGVCMAVSLLVKITALFTLAAVLLWSIDYAGQGTSGARGPRAKGYLLVVCVLVGAFELAVVALLASLPRELWRSASIHFLLPNVLLGILLAQRAARAGKTAYEGCRTLMSLVGPVVVGILGGLAPFVAFYAWIGALHDLGVGVFVRPAIRMRGFFFGPPGGLATIMALVVPLVLFVGMTWAARRLVQRRSTIIAVVLGTAFGGVAHLNSGDAASALALSVRSIPIILPLVAVLWDSSRERAGADWSAAVLLVALSSTTQLTQVPFAWYPYFLFVAPIGILASFMLLHVHAEVGRAVAAFWTMFLLVSGASHVPGSLDAEDGRRLAVLPFARGGLRVSPLDSSRYSRVAAAVRARPAGPLLVVGGAPELQVLLERTNPRRLIYDVLADSVERDTTRLMAEMDRRRVSTAVIRTWGSSVDSVMQESAAVVRARFPCQVRVGRFEVRWRNDLAPPAPGVDAGCSP